MTEEPVRAVAREGDLRLKSEPFGFCSVHGNYFGSVWCPQCDRAGFGGTRVSPWKP
jgi:hypothetical protein